MASKELFLLLRILDERNTGLRRDDVAWAFEPPKKAETEAWVREYISPYTLLSKEEFAFYDSIGQQLPKKDPSQTGHPLSDEDYEHAITSLEASTAAIEKQCRLMEAQKRALQAMKSSNAASENSESAAERQQRKLARDNAQLDLELEEVSSFLKSRLRGSLKQTESAVANLPTTVQRLLGKDDRLLDGLQKVLLKLEGDSDDAAVLSEVDKLSHAFKILEAKAIRARIDATYRSHLSDESANGDTHDNQQEALLIELEELSGEIDGLVSLVAENYYKLPISTGLRNASNESQGKSARWSEYLGATLQYLAGRLETLDEHFQHVHVHKMALASASLALENTLATPSTAKAEQQNTSQAAAKTPQKGLKPLRLVQENISEPIDPSAQLLQHLDIRSSNVKDTDKLAQLLQDTREERQDKIASTEASTEELMMRQLVESLNGADVNVRELLGAVFAYTKYNTRKLVDESVQSQVDDLEGKTHLLGEKMRELDLDGLTMEVKRAQRKVLSQQQK